MKFIKAITCITSLLFLMPNFAQQVDAGNGHSIVLEKDKTVWTTGRNDHGQLGTGDYLNKDERQNTGLSNIAVIARGYDHSMAIDEAGALWVWGNNLFGQLAVGHNSDVLKPLKSNVLHEFAQCEGGKDHSIFLDKEGRVWASGLNQHGELGNLNLDDSNVMVAVRLEKGEQLSNIAQIVSVGFHSMALDSNGFIYSWGANYYGELGHFNVDVQPFADKVEGLQDIHSIAVGWSHSIALNENGDVFTWGANAATYGAETGRKTEFYDTIIQLTGLPKISSIACGSWHSLALDNEGKVWSWGRNMYGMLGNGTTVSEEFPIQMIGIEKAESIGGGCFQSMVVDSSGNIFTCGDNVFGQLGLANDDRQLAPVQMASVLSNSSFGTPVIVALVLFFMSVLFLLVWRKQGQKI
ncbi:MAG: alpha-tubulin suppressor-like RCC1 family protein [Crocinitomix sp.]